MSELKATKGPWHLHRNNAFIDILADDGTSYSIASIHRWDYPDEYEANAHLITSAPELYEALESLVRAERAFESDAKIKFDDRISDALFAAEFILKKARGEI